MGRMKELARRLDDLCECCDDNNCEGCIRVIDIDSKYVIVDSYNNILTVEERKQ